MSENMVQTQAEQLSNKLNIDMNFSTQEGAMQQSVQQYMMYNNSKLDESIHLIINNKLMLQYLPVVHLETGYFLYYETVLNLYSKEEDILDISFVKNIEQAGLSAIIDEWVAIQIKKDLKVLRDKNQAVALSMNIHISTFSNHKTIENIITILKDEDITFNITDIGLIENKILYKNIHKLKEHGFKISINNFGNKNTSLKLLEHLPIDMIKIDKSLLKASHTEKGLILYQHIYSMCKALNFTCVADGVANKEEKKRIKSIGIEYAQGVYFAEPMELEEIRYYNIWGI